MTKPKSILFVCLGNIVRSPLAEHLFRHLADGSAGLEGIQVGSAGTSSYHIGDAPDARMRQTAELHGLKYTGRAKRVSRKDLESYDLIIAMDQDNYDVLFAMMNPSQDHNKLHLLREFDPDGDHNLSVPDPYYGGQEGFETTFQIVKRSTEGLIKAIQDGTL
jgi:protein-tyrosine phosphatase